MSTPSQEAEHWDQVGEEDLHGVPAYDTKPVIARLQVGPQMRCLDMGCGIGRLTNAVAWRGLDPRVYGFDISRRNIFKAAERAPHNAFYWVSDGRNIPSGITGKFDLIWSVTMFQHVPHDVKWGYIRQAAERLNPGGRLVFSYALGDEPPTFLNHQYTADEVRDLAIAMTELFDEVALDGPDDNGWNWMEATK